MPQLYRSATASPAVGSTSRPAHGPSNPPPRNAILSSATRKPSLLSQQQTIDDTDGTSAEVEKHESDMQESVATSGLSTDEDDQEPNPLLATAKAISTRSRFEKRRDTLGEGTGLEEMAELAKVYESVVQKLKEMNDTIAGIAQIKNEALEVLHFQREIEDRDVKEIANQLEMMEEYKKELGTIEGLKGQVKLQSERVQMCQDRLRSVQVKMDSVKQNEIMWKQRQSKRLRILWGIALTLLVVWFLLAMPGRTDLEVIEQPQVPQKVQEPQAHKDLPTLTIFTTRNLEDTPEIDSGDDV
ncbi:hypothetical protein BJ508DRAFT_416025 [Ascobolus immersus RN42]|uniref:Uncharacterized protein n=1 Tax=Ascobolus immersus RN42 TaxID=1160509 RepID=A0A3N4I3J2_ASCIM|nr:hypothetical protein BJ508DRAFT_416025 [Ascobolus immersus RN42]